MFFDSEIQSGDNASMLKDRFRSARKRTNLTQEEVGERIGVTQTTVWKIENGDTEQPRHIKRYAKLYDCSSEWLTHGVNPPAWAVSPNSIEEPVTPAYGEDKPKPSKLSPTETKLLYLCLVKAQSSLEKQKELFGDDYSFKTLAKSAAAIFNDDIEAGVDVDMQIKELEEEERATPVKAG